MWWMCTYLLQGQLHLTLLTCIKITENAIQANEYYPRETVLIAHWIPQYNKTSITHEAALLTFIASVSYSYMVH